MARVEGGIGSADGQRRYTGLGLKNKSRWTKHRPAGVLTRGNHMTDEEKIGFVQQLYATTGAGDFDTAETMLTDDFFIIEAEGLPMAGEFRGKTALRDLYSHVFGTLKVADLEPEGMTVGGDYVINLVSFRFENPDLAPARLAELFCFRDGKVCEIRPYYFDPKPIVDAWAYYEQQSA